MNVNLSVDRLVSLKEFTHQIFFMFLLIFLFVNIILQKLSLAQLHRNIEVVELVGHFLSCGLLVISLLIVLRTILTQPSNLLWPCCSLKRSYFFLRFFSATQVLVHVNLFIMFPDCFLLAVSSFIVRAGTRLNVAFLFGEELAEVDIIPLLNFFDILLEFFKLLVILNSTIADHMFCEIFGNEKILLNYFIEGSPKMAVLLDGPPIVLKYTFTNPFNGCLQYFQQTQEKSQHLSSLIEKYFEMGSSYPSSPSAKGSAKPTRNPSSLIANALLFTQTWAINLLKMEVIS